MKKTSVWDTIAWVVLFLILVWVILKVFRIINTPVYLEYFPIFGVIYLAGWAIHKLDTAVDNIKDLKGFEKATIKEIHDINTRCIKNHG